MDGSGLVFALREPASRRLVAFARVLSDFVFKAIIFDVIIAPSHRRLGIGEALLRRILAHPRLRRVRDVELYCLPDTNEPFAAGGAR